MFDFDVKPNFTVDERSRHLQPPDGGFRHRRSRRAQPAAARRARRTVAAAVRWLAGSCRAARRGAPWRQQPVPALKARVTDLTGTLTAAQQATLEQKLAAFEARKGSQLAVLMVPDDRAGRHRAVLDPRRRAMEARPRRQSTTARCCSSQRTTAACASRWARASRARSRMRPRAASSPRPSRRCSGRAISPAASTPASTR